MVIRIKKAAMEMSVGTIVTIVLLMIVLVLGIFFIQKIFTTGTNAIDTIDNEIQNQLQKLFAEETRTIAVYPTSREVTIKKGDTPKGFAFSVRNNDVNEATFNYKVESEDVSSCGGSITKENANSYILGGTGSFKLAAGNSLDLPRLVKFNIPSSAPPCTISYTLKITKNVNNKESPYSDVQVFLTIK
ncbi:MAG: hypothetical protein KatS3mg001_467 [Candidatus Pacearchaeota archaeon]|nr:MAG: hypothetical protein KatS3mg001_467 [Candidatus Pacearchaeota archaeon]